MRFSFPWQFFFVFFLFGFSAAGQAIPTIPETPPGNDRLPDSKAEPEETEPAVPSKNRVTSRPSRYNPNPHIPEPMFFDLVRGLGAERGELEVNVLGRLDFGQPVATWAPEVEYAFLDGHSVEIELPFEDKSLKAFKFAFQGTLGTFRSHRGIHGWQVIGERARKIASFRLDAMHLTGYRFSERWSVFSMHGVRRSLGRQADREWAGIFNPSIFFEPNHRIILGLESNFVIGRAAQRNALVLPQIQIAFNRGYFVEFGLGFEKPTLGAFRPVTAVRVIKSFHLGR
jgi:hypothetical protein